MPPSLAPTVLHVDDDYTARYLLRRLLHQAHPGVRALEAANGSLGLALLRAQCQFNPTPQSLLVVLDLDMPVLNGAEFLAQYHCLAAYHQVVSTVVVSSATRSEQALARIRPLVAQVLPKPVSAAGLAEVVARYLPGAAALLAA